MLLTSAGLILLLIPFLLVFYWEDRQRGFLYVATAAAAWHLAVALVTQTFQIFSYPVVLGLNGLAAAAVLLFVVKERPRFRWRVNLNWWAIAAGVIIVFELWSVHHLYTGEVKTINSGHREVRSAYAYPYFSDEWIGVALINYSIAHEALPTVNPLMDKYGYEEFLNIFVAFFALLAELFLLLQLAPLTGYATFALAAGGLTCFLIYKLLRAHDIGIFPALLAALCLPYIVNGANLPGLWYLLPFNGSVILWLLSLLGFSVRNRLVAWSSGVLALFLYPPLIVFVAPAFLADLLTDRFLTAGAKWRRLGGAAALVAGLAAAVIFLQEYDLARTWQTIVSFIWRLNLEGAIPSYPVWNVFPAVLLPLVLFGLIATKKKKYAYILAPTVTGILFWIFYSFSRRLFIIDYARVVIVTSLLLMFFAGLGGQELIRRLQEKYSLGQRADWQWRLKFACLALFLLAACFYTERAAWKKLTLPIAAPGGVTHVTPAAPANRYLHPDDLIVFRSISRARFLSVPWKGLVIGVATGNYPLHSKDSIITNQVINYYAFMAADCDTKTTLAWQTELSYVYAPPFSCPDFDWRGASREGLHLYEFQP